jgi:hypothetical protein
VSSYSDDVRKSPDLSEGLLASFFICIFLIFNCRFSYPMSVKQFITLLAITFCIYVPVNAQDYIWAKTLLAGGSSYNQWEQGRSIVTDGSGNVYITGSVDQPTVDFDPGPGTVTLQAINNYRTIFFAKYTASGNYVWARLLASPSNYGHGNSIALDASGNIYITGYQTGGIDFDPGVGTATLSTGWGAFFAKYDNNGNYIWAKGLTSYSYNVSEGNAITVDNSGNVYISGFFYETVDFDPGAGTASITAAITGTTPYSDVFFAKYDSNGNYVWAKSFGDTREDASNAIKVDGSGNVYITGYFNGVVDFDPGSGTSTMTAAVTGGNIDPDAFFAKYDGNGNYVWAKSITSTNADDAGNSITVDASGNVYVGGDFAGTADFDPSASNSFITGVAGSANLFIAKYNSSGTYVWAKSTDTQTYTSAAETRCNSLALDASNNIYITGNLHGYAVDFDPGSGTNNLSSAYYVGSFGQILTSGSDIFFAKYDNNGNHVWAKALNRGNNGNYVFLNSKSKSIAVSTLGQVHITGYYETSSSSTLDFDPGPGTVTMTALGGGDIFFAKYNSCPGPTITASSGAICPGQTYSMSISGASTYSVNGTAVSAYTFNPLSTTVYSVTGTNSLACTSANAITATITVQTSPSVSASSGSICSGKVYTISVAGATTYSINGVGSTNFTVNPTTNTNYSITGTGTNSCVSSNTAIATVTVYTLPVISASGSSICAGSTASITVNGANTYSVNGNSASNFTFSPTVTTNYNITGTDANGCVSGTAAVATITVHAIPVVNAVSGGVCTGSIFTLNVSGASSYSINGNAASSFTFNPSSNTQYSVTGTSAVGCVSSNTAVAAVTVYSLPVVSASGGTLCSGKVYTMTVSGANTYSVNGNAVTTLTFSPMTNTTYSITGKSAQGCVSSNTAVASISVSPSPTVSVNSSSVCAGNVATITASGANLYSWSNSQTGTSIHVTPAVTSTYTVTGTDAGNGCTNAATATVTVHSTSITVSGSSTICVNETGTLVASGATTYTWSTTENGATISASPSLTTTYTVQGTDGNGCIGSNLATLTVEECTGISETGNGNELKIYPNPANDILNVELGNIENTYIFVYDVCGKEIMSKQIEGTEARINVDNLAKGVYLIKVGTWVQKFVKE